MANFLIDFRNTAATQQIEDYLLSNQCTVIKVFSKFEKVFLVSSLTTPDNSDIVESIVLDDESTALNLLDLIQLQPTPTPNSVNLSVTDAKNWWKTYTLSEIDFNLTEMSVPQYGAGVNVYIMDSGLEASHPEFADSDVELVHSFTGDFTDTTGHGTALSSVIVGKTCSLTSASLKVIKIFDKNVATKQSDLLIALEAILNHASTSSNSVHVVNMSWGIPKNQYIESKLKLLYDLGFILVAAAGNNGSPIQDVTPASMHEVVTVGSYNADFIPSNFSNYTDPLLTSLTTNETNSGALDTWAPGENIWSAGIGGGYGNTAGTSVAAAIASATLAYNLSIQLDENGQLYSTFKDLDGKYLTNSVLYPSREGLLDLSDPKYSNSNNLIVTMGKYNMKVPSYIPDRPMRLIVKTGYFAWAKIFNYNDTVSYEVDLSTLPSFVSIEKDRIIARPITEPLDSSGVDQHTINITFTDKNNNSKTVNFLVVHTATTFDRDQLPSDDPLLEITPYATCTYTPDVCMWASCPILQDFCETVAKGGCFCMNPNI